MFTMLLRAISEGFAGILWLLIAYKFTIADHEMELSY